MKWITSRLNALLASTNVQNVGIARVFIPMKEVGMYDDFDKFADLAKMLYEYVAVCRCQHGHEELFSIPFESQAQLEAFLSRNDGDVKEIGFYAQGFANGEYIGENT